jgi:hypothetical protein
MGPGSGWHVVVRLPVAAAEALSDAVAGDPDGWPDDWPDHAEAFAVALRAVDDALNGDAGPPDCCIHCIGHRYGLLDHELHDRLIRAARDAGYVILGSTLHAVDGCYIARGAHPAVIEVGGYRGRRLPVFVTRADGERWLSASPKRKACKICGSGRSLA